MGAEVPQVQFIDKVNDVVNNLETITSWCHCFLGGFENWRRHLQDWTFGGGSGHGMTKNGVEFVNHLIDWTARRCVLFLLSPRRIMEDFLRFLRAGVVHGCMSSSVSPRFSVECTFPR